MTRRPTPPANDNKDRAPDGAEPKSAEPKSAEPKATEPKSASCVICGKTQNPAHVPFCSPRCADIDLGRWLNGAYAIPAVDDDDDEDGVSSGGEG